MKLILFGAPGAGKGTQAEFLSKRLGVPTISTGEILRAAMKKGTAVGKEAKAYVDSGRLVPDDVIIGIIQERLAEPDCQKGYILDGVPRTLAQAEAMERMGVDVDVVLNLEIPDETIVERLCGRRICKDCGASYHLISNPPQKEGRCDSCGGELIIRRDDSPETVRERLRVYHAETEPLKAHYAASGKLRTVQSQERLEDTSRMVRETLGL
ncbi:MAG: adenylate kinase [Firmicutes bacterium]|nr:adenylate kinase [Bacillota bacterium]